MSEESQQHIEALRRMVETRDLLIADLEREIKELRADRDALLATIRYCTDILIAAGHDPAAPLEAMVRRSIAYGAPLNRPCDTCGSTLHHSDLCERE